MKYVSAVFLLAVIAVVVADYGYYVPKAFYKIDENGHKSPSYYIEIPESAVHPRFRRSPQFNPYFQPIQFPQPGFPFQPIPGGNTQYSGISTSTTTGGSGNLASRFGEDEPPKTQGQTTTFQSGPNGQFTQTTHTFGGNGQVHTTVQKGKL